jgi:hypothetical protein
MSMELDPPDPLPTPHYGHEPIDLQEVVEFAGPGVVQAGQYILLGELLRIALPAGGEWAVVIDVNLGDYDWTDDPLDVEQEISVQGLWRGHIAAGQLVEYVEP